MGVFTRALRNISRKKLRTLLVVIALGFSMAIMVSIPSGILANQTSTEQLIGNFDTTITNLEAEINKTLTLVECSISSGFTEQRGPSGGFQPPGGFDPGNMPGLMTRSVTYLNESTITDIVAIEGVKDIVAIIEKTEGTNQTIQTPRGTFQILVPDYTIVGVPLNSSLIDNYAFLPTNIVEGRNLLEGDSMVVLLSLNNTEYFGVGVGGSVDILGASFTVIGIYEPSDSQEATNLYMSLTDAQTITDLSGKLSRLEVYAVDQSHVDVIVNQIEQLYPEFTLTTYETRLAQLERQQEMYATTLENAQATLSQTQTVAYQEIGIAVVATSLIVLFIMLYTVRERTHEIGIFKAIGFSNGNIMSQFMLEGILMSVIAGVVGVAIGVIAAPLLSSLLLPSATRFTSNSPGMNSPGIGTNLLGIPFTSAMTASLNPQLIFLAFGAMVLLGALGSLYPAWRASRTSPMEALKYE
ncbi:MAG: transporter permease [Thermoproteota archaeon]|nr:transporter permease [Thermoproteota archaeon]